MKCTEWTLVRYTVQTVSSSFDVWALDASDACERLASCGVDLGPLCFVNERTA